MNYLFLIAILSLIVGIQDATIVNFYQLRHLIHLQEYKFMAILEAPLSTMPKLR